MDIFAIVSAIAGAIFVGAMSPGPSFVVVTQTAVATSRSNGVAAAIGMGVGGAAFAAAALMGLHVLLSNVPWLYIGLKIAGGCYLLYLAARLWRGAGDAVAMDAPGLTGSRGLAGSFVLGLTTQLSNPKTAVVYASVFAALLPQTAPMWFAVILVPLVFVIEAGWYALVAILFSLDRARRSYMSSKLWVDRFASGVMGLLGAKIIAGRWVRSMTLAIV